MQKAPVGNTTFRRRDLILQKEYKDILVIDDDQDIINLIRMGLKNEGHYNLLSATSSDEAILLALKNSPDLIIADIHLPKTLGPKLSSDINSLRQKAIPIIFISHDERIGKNLEHGEYQEITHFIKKPIDLRELKTSIEELLKT